MAKSLSCGLAAAAGLAATLSIGAGQAAAQPDLIPLLNNPMNASVGVQNIGDSVAAASHLTLNCTKFGQADGGCPDIPGLAAYMNPAFPNRVVINVPQLQPGQSFNHNLAFWNAIVWPAGTYIFDAEADAGNAIAEANEGNNGTQSSHTQQPGAGVAPALPLPLAAKPGRPAAPTRQKPAAGAIAVELAKPDLMATTLGSFIGGDLSAWNQVQTVRASTISETRFGPNGDECLVPSKVRLMNIGQADSGNFRLSIYVDGQLKHQKQALQLSQGENKWIPYDLRLKEGTNMVEIRIDDLNQVVEKNENNNLYKTTVRMPFDCDGVVVLNNGGAKVVPLAPVKPQRPAPTRPSEPKPLPPRPAN